MSAGTMLCGVIRALSAARVATGRSQADVAVAIGVTRQALGAWESFVATPSTEHLFKWAHVLGVELVARPAEGAGQ